MNKTVRCITKGDFFISIKFVIIKAKRNLPFIIGSVHFILSISYPIVAASRLISPTQTLLRNELVCLDNIQYMNVPNVILTLIIYLDLHNCTCNNCSNS